MPRPSSGAALKQRNTGVGDRELWRVEAHHGECGGMVFCRGSGARLVTGVGSSSQALTRRLLCETTTPSFLYASRNGTLSHVC